MFLVLITVPNWTNSFSSVRHNLKKGNNPHLTQIHGTFLRLVTAYQGIFMHWIQYLHFISTTSCLLLCAVYIQMHEHGIDMLWQQFACYATVSLFLSYMYMRTYPGWFSSPSRPGGLWRSDTTSWCTAAPSPPHRHSDRGPGLLPGLRGSTSASLGAGPTGITQCPLGRGLKQIK